VAYKASEASKNDAYNQGYKDAQEGKFSPPKGDGVVDFVFAPIDYIAESPSTREVAEAKAEAYRDGHSAGSRR
jgi:hypothetical protein